MKGNAGILFVISLVLSTLLVAQESSNTDTLNFILEINPSLLESTDSNKVIRIQILGTDSSITVLKTTNNGVVETKLKPNTSYTINVFAEGYLNATGRETTLGKSKSSKITHKFSLQPLETCKLYGLSIAYENNNYKSPIDSLYPEINIFESYKNIIADNQPLKFQITGFCEKNEPLNMAEKRAKYFKKQLIKMGIKNSRLMVDYKPYGFSAIESEEPSLQNKSQIRHNRIVLIGIIKE